MKQKRAQKRRVLKSTLYAFSLLVVYIMLGIPTLKAQNSRIYVGYSNISSLENKHTEMGVNDRNKIAVYERLDSTTFASMEGLKAIGVRFAFNYEDPGFKINGELAYDNPKKLKHVGWHTGVKKGWNEIMFNKAYEIKKNNTVHFGYSYVHTIGQVNPILLSASDDTPDGLLISVGGSNFFDGKTNGYNNLLAQLIIEGPTDKLQNAALLISSDLPVSPQAGATRPLKIKVRNAGLTPTSSMEVEVNIKGSKKLYEITLDKPIQTDEDSQREVQLPEEILIPDSHSEQIPVSIRIVKVNGKENLLQKTLNYEIIPASAGAIFQRTILAEQFSTESCSGCPEAEEKMHKAYEEFGEDKVVWIIHHLGAGEDFLTLNQCKALLRLYPSNGGNVFAPALMIDRKNTFSGMMYAPSPINAFPKDSEALKRLFGEAMKAPSLVALNIDCGTRGSGKYGITVTGKVSPSLKKENLHITAMLVQSHIPQKEQNGLAPGQEFEHMFAPRRYFTSGEGDPLVINNDGSFTFDKEIELKKIPDEVEDYTVVAFVHKWNASGYENNEVMNASKMEMKTTPLAADKVAPKENMRPIVNGSTISIEPYSPYYTTTIFNINGEKCQNGALSSGIYVVRVIDELQEIHTFKVVIP